jgi:hypothetical protein
MPDAQLETAFFDWKARFTANKSDVNDDNRVAPVGQHVRGVALRLRSARQRPCRRGDANGTPCPRKSH